MGEDSYLCNIDRQEELRDRPGPVERAQGYLHGVHCLLLEVHIHPRNSSESRASHRKVYVSELPAELPRPAMSARAEHFTETPKPKTTSSISSQT